MCNLLKVIKFNEEYFDNGQVVVVTKENGEVNVGSVLLLDYDGGIVTSNHCLVLDTSEKFHHERAYIDFKEIANVQRVKK